MEHLEIEGICRLKVIDQHFKPVHIAFEGSVYQLHRDDGQDQFLTFCKQQALLNDLLISDGRVFSSQLMIDIFDSTSSTSKQPSSQLRRCSLYFLALDAGRPNLS